MIANLRETTAGEPRAGLAEHEPRAVLRDDAGPGDLRAVEPADHVRADAARRRAARRLLHGLADGDEEETGLRLIASYALQASARTSRTRSSSARGSSARRRSSEVDPRHAGARGLHHDHVRPRRGGAGQHRRAAGPLRGPGEGGRRARVVHSRSRETHCTFLEQLSETIGVVLNMIGANMRTEELLQQSQSLAQELQTQSEELQAQQDELERTNASSRSRRSR